MLEKAYRFVDDRLMGVANAAVKSANWTFGITKRQLANRMLGVAPVFEGHGSI
ncbi:hypothetical protein HN832_05060 [archaeon]|nr:hypothetical protein [archaeon]MBT4373728.1 hypothetical protein [archaeon]MBT4532305.1 hypothetical protein [archaeon]MBT7001941.1 hypothetical protein [archaeon]MBT7282754.1 hypothetical protein [archaeon]